MCTRKNRKGVCHYCLQKKKNDRTKSSIAVDESSQFSKPLLIALYHASVQNAINIFPATGATLPRKGLGSKSHSDFRLASTEVGKQSICIYNRQWRSHNKHSLAVAFAPCTPILATETEVIFIANKSKMFCFRVSERDYLSIQHKAEKAKLSMTAYITASALQRQIVVIDGLDKVITELKAIGNNLNQLTTLCNMGKIQSLELAKTKERLGDLFGAILALTER